ncbi:hypothetical protein CANCADRAFT_1904 [Tortispora caseinolytica NRRL Y-17796]|uniref:SWIRM domain-containing protein n=1 Tax=Tortispora caseinolytica NRRL Y-17796 TaxID=767744 RepID=A0A1E4TEH2_9ASCO|nr:hypothetical protein CANCADRAFT_1904 [Tortispora caseinolytica NRRL Y-17796]
MSYVSDLIQSDQPTPVLISPPLSPGEDKSSVKSEDAELAKRLAQQRLEERSTLRPSFPRVLSDTSSNDSPSSANHITASSARDTGIMRLKLLDHTLPIGPVMSAPNSPALEKGDAFKVKQPQTSTTTTAWDSLRKDPLSYYKRERSFLSRYARAGSNSPVRGNDRPVTAACSPLAVKALARLTRLPPRASRTHSNPPPRSRREASVDTRDRRIMHLERGRRAESIASSAGSRSPSPYALRNNPDHSTHSSSGLSQVHRPDEDVEMASPPTYVPARRPATPVRRVIAGTVGGSRESSPLRRTSSPASKVHDMDFAALPDYSPPISTLSNGKQLRAEWKGAAMDLSDDPEAHLLHPAELQLASTLRLPCQLYLDSKRRIFAEKVHRLKNGLPFRRTDSQKACRIDVNKASRLYMAFERVGWLNDDLFQQYL